MIDSILAWLGGHQALTVGAAVFSVVSFVGSLIALPHLVAAIPVDYFSDPGLRRSRLQSQHPVIYWGLRILKNLVGWVLILVGLVMLVLPGQGLLTLLVGLLFSDFPGKFHLEQRLASTPRVLGAINWLRRRGGHAPLLAPGEVAETASDTCGSDRQS